MLLRLPDQAGAVPAARIEHVLEPSAEATAPYEARNVVRISIPVKRARAFGGVQQNRPADRIRANRAICARILREASRVSAGAYLATPSTYVLAREDFRRRPRATNNCERGSET